MRDTRRNPVYDQPDAHELTLVEYLGRFAAHFKLLPSTRAQRRARAAYWRKKALRQIPAARPR